MAFIFTIALDFGHALYYWETAARLPIFVEGVFGNDMVFKLKFAGLFVLFIAGCEVSE